MQDRPTAPELLAVARDTVLDELVPLLPAARRLDALIVANVMAIAARELEAGDAPLAAELQRLCALYDDAPGPGETAAAAVARLTKRLAADIRAGAFEADRERLAAVRDHLAATTRDKLRINNPRYLEAEGEG